VKKIIEDSLIQNNQYYYSNHALKTVLVVVTAVLCTFAAVLKHTRPRLFRRAHSVAPPFYLATTYPNGMVLERDLPRFFRQYSIATPDNVFAQTAFRKVLRSRNQLRKRVGSATAVNVKAWDESNVEHLLAHGICGEDYAQAHRAAKSPREREQLLVWCLLASQIAEGVFVESVEMLDSALSLTRNRGIVVRKQPPAGIGIADGYGALSTSFYLHPRTRDNDTDTDNDNDTDDPVNWIPMKVLATLIRSSKDRVGEDVHDLAERTLYELVVSEGHEKDYLILEEVCQDDRPERSIALDTGDRSDGCYFVVPQKYGGNFNPIEDDDDDD